MTNLQTRIITAVVLGIATLWLTYIGGVSFTLFSIVIGCAIFYEWTTLSASRQSGAGRVFGWIWLALVFGLLIWDQGALWTIATLLVGCVILGLMTWRQEQGQGQGNFWPAAGLFYAGLPAIALALLRGDEPFGFGMIILLFAIVWSTDIAAYFTGRLLGGPKLAPRFSPNKTWSGAIGGVIAAMLAGVFVVWFMTDSLSLIVLVLALVLSIVSQIGDLGESWVKRQFGAKDSGKLLPGHGGVMDRVDGLVAAAAVLYIIGAVLAEPDVPSALFFSF